MNKERRTRKRERNFWWKYLRLKEKEEEGGEDGLWREGKGLIWYWMWGSQWCSHGNWEIEKKASKAKKPISVLTVECGVWTETDGGFFVYLKKKRRGGGHVVAFKFQPTARTTRVNLSLSLSWRLLFIARIKCVWLHGYIWLSWDWEILL